MLIDRVDIYDFRVVVTKAEFDELCQLAESRVLTVEDMLLQIIDEGTDVENNY